MGPFVGWVGKMKRKLEQLRLELDDRMRVCVGLFSLVMTAWVCMRMIRSSCIVSYKSGCCVGILSGCKVYMTPSQLGVSSRIVGFTVDGPYAWVGAHYGGLVRCNYIAGVPNY